MSPDEQFYITEITEHQTRHGPYKATLADTRLTLYSQDSIDDAIGYVQAAIVDAYQKGYA